MKHDITIDLAWIQVGDRRRPMNLCKLDLRVPTMTAGRPRDPDEIHYDLENQAQGIFDRAHFDMNRLAYVGSTTPSGELWFGALNNPAVTAKSWAYNTEGTPASAGRLLSEAICTSVNDMIRGPRGREPLYLPPEKILVPSGILSMLSNNPSDTPGMSLLKKLYDDLDKLLAGFGLPGLKGDAIKPVFLLQDRIVMMARIMPIRVGGSIIYQFEFPVTAILRTPVYESSRRDEAGLEHRDLQATYYWAMSEVLVHDPRALYYLDLR